MFLWIVAIGIVLIVIIRFATALSKDKGDLQGGTLEEKFSVIVDLLNEAAYKGRGSTWPLSWRSFNLYEDGSNQIINFDYSTGILTLTWKYKYLHQEMIHSANFNNLRDVSEAAQERIAQKFIEDSFVRIQAHIHNVVTKGNF
ncbi:MAG: hypothetical protein J7578_25295 [Chitinophagaceae bacterium]|nr:hypothetical protein [Chitinophagaceae bacterium]